MTPAELFLVDLAENADWYPSAIELRAGNYRDELFVKALRILAPSGYGRPYSIQLFESNRDDRWRIYKANGDCVTSFHKNDESIARQLVDELNGVTGSDPKG